MNQLCKQGGGAALRIALLGVLLGSWGTYMFLGGRSSQVKLPWSAPTTPDYSAKALQKDFDMANELRKGGYILYFRHAQRQKWDSVIAFDVYETFTKTDATKASFYDAVCLTPQGIEEGKMIGKVFEAAKIPVSQVTASPICRASQTAQLAFGRIDTVAPALIHTPVVNAGNADAFKKGVAETLRTIPVKEGTNAVIMAHGNTLNNNMELFKSGKELIEGEQLKETGFFVIRRNSDGSLDLVHRYLSLGEFAASALNLTPS